MRSLATASRDEQARRRRRRAAFRMASEPKNCATALPSTRRHPLKSVKSSRRCASCPPAHREVRRGHVLLAPRKPFFARGSQKKSTFFVSLAEVGRSYAKIAPVPQFLGAFFANRAIELTISVGGLRFANASSCGADLDSGRPRLRRRPSQRLRPPLVCFSQFACQPWNRTIFQNRSMPRTNSCGFFRSIRAAFTSSS